MHRTPTVTPARSATSEPRPVFALCLTVLVLPCPTLEHTVHGMACLHFTCDEHMIRFRLHSQAWWGIVSEQAVLWLPVSTTL